METNNTTQKHSLLSPAVAQIRDFWRDVGSRRSYWMPLLLLAILGFGYSTFNQTLSIDDLARGYYLMDDMAMIASTRWGMTLWMLLFSSVEFSPFIDKLLGVAFWMAGATLGAALLYAVNGRKKCLWPYAAFSCLVLTYPLVNEIWEYSGANMVVPGNLVLTCLALHLLVSQPRRTLGATVVAGVLMTFVTASYESGTFVYITMVFMLLYLKYSSAAAPAGRWQWLREGASYVPALAISVVLRFAVGYGLIALLGLQHMRVGATTINWLTEGVTKSLRYLRYNLRDYGILRAAYLPIAVFDAAAAFFTAHFVVRCVRKRSLRPLLIGLLLLASLFSLAFIQGCTMPYRTAQTIQIFVGFAGYLLVDALPHGDPRPRARRFAALVTALCLFLSFRQAICLHRILALNHQRSENEISIIHDIGDRLYGGYDLSKPVVFTGNVRLGSWIEDQVSAQVRGKTQRLVSTNVNSMLNWGKRAFYGQREMKHYFALCGYDIQVIETFDGAHSYDGYLAAATSAGMAPMEIRDMGDYIMVYFGD